VSFKDKISYCDVSVSGDVFVQDQLKHLVKVGSVDFQQDDCKGNPVLAYLQHHGSPQRLPTLLANDRYTLASAGTVFNAPLTNEPYSVISGDFNPIHVNPYFSHYTSLSATITHGLWSSAATCRYVENIVAHGHPGFFFPSLYDCILIDVVHCSHNVTFVSMVLSGDELAITIRHVGMRDGNIVVKIQTANSCCKKFLKAWLRLHSLSQFTYSQVKDCRSPGHRFFQW
jgi:fatty acid synthase subunit alpha, fungi type